NKGAGHSQWHGEKDRKRIYKAFKLGGQDEVYEHDRKHESERGVARTFRKVPGNSGQRSVERIIQKVGGNFLHSFDTVANCSAWRQACRYSGGAVAIKVVKRRWRC